MPKLIMNEKKYVEKILDTHDVADIDITMEQLIYLLVKYFYENETWHDQDGCIVDKPLIYKETENDGDKKEYNKEVFKSTLDILYVDVDLELQKFNFEKYYSFKYKNLILNACNIVLKYDLKLKEYDYIPLLSDELENIKQCENDRERKLLFTLYIYARYKNKNGKIDEDAVKKDIFKMANINSTKLEMNKIVKSLRDKEFISQNFINDNINIWVTLGTGEEVMNVISFDNLGNQIIAYLNKDKKMCECCGRIIKIKSKTCPPRYCNDCAYKIKNEQTKNSVKRIRNEMLEKFEA